MKSRPILFNGPMVRALLDGRKTQTRRVFKLPNGHRWDDLQGGADSGNIECDKWPGTWHVSEFRCPYGQPGDQLWVRETWYCDDFRVQCGPYLKPDDMDVTAAREDGTLVYAADGLSPYEADQPVWKPSIHMPRWASRITLEIVSVRIERLQDISRGDAMAEGCPFPNMADGDDPRKWYADLWNTINGPGSWDANPLVWVVEFKVVRP